MYYCTPESTLIFQETEQMDLKCQTNLKYYHFCLKTLIRKCRGYTVLIKNRFGSHPHIFHMHHQISNQGIPKKYCTASQNRSLVVLKDWLLQ